MATLVTGLTTLCSAVDATAVKEIIDTDLTDAQVNAFLNQAYYIALPLTGELDDCGSGSAQCEIIKLLAAHLLSMRDRRTKSENVAGEWSVTYDTSIGLALDQTPYGQMAKVMDCSGKLAKLGLKRARFEVIGEADSDYVDEY